MSITIGFIGAGNMAGALSGGLLAKGQAATALALSDPSDSQLQSFRERGIWTTGDNRALVERSDVLVLAVKPQVMKEVLQPLADIVQARQPLVISIAAGIPVAAIERWLGGNVAVVRAMPNTPALVQSGATGLYANDQVGMELRRQAEEILGAVGMTVWVDDEALIDSVTAVSGSTPTFTYSVRDSSLVGSRESTPMIASISGFDSRAAASRPPQ